MPTILETFDMAFWRYYPSFRFFFVFLFGRLSLVFSLNETWLFIEANKKQMHINSLKRIEINLLYKYEWISQHKKYSQEYFAPFNYTILYIYNSDHY